MQKVCIYCSVHIIAQLFAIRFVSLWFGTSTNPSVYIWLPETTRSRWLSKPCLTEYLTRSADKCSFFNGSRQLRTRACRHDDYKSGPPRKCLSLALAGWTSYGMLQEEPGTLRYCQGEIDRLWIHGRNLGAMDVNNCYVKKERKKTVSIIIITFTCMLLHVQRVPVFYMYLCNNKRASTL